MAEWKLADAKNRFTELVNRALAEGPQTVRRRNDTVIVLSAKDYDRLKQKTGSFKEFLLNRPSLDGLDLSRDSSPPRDAKL